MKKFLSLVLALVMTMSLVTVSAGAKDFTDSSKINYAEAVDVLSEAKVIDGYADGAFNPSNTLTRGAAAKIICNLILGPTTASALVADAAPYKDVPTNHTFAGYIAYCQKEGIISGYADGTFRPANTLTGYAFMKMLLGALGYDSDVEGYTGPNWSIAVAKRALNAGLADDMKGDFNGVKAVTREEAALFAFNTLKADMVEYSAKTSVSTGNTTVVIAGSEAKKVFNSESKDYRTKASTKDEVKQFCEAYFSDLQLRNAGSAADSFGRPSNTWFNDKTKIGTYAKTPDVTYYKSVKAKDIAKDLDLDKTDYYWFDVVVDGKETTDAIKIDKNVDTKLKDAVSEKVGTGSLVEVYKDDEVITVVNTFLMKVDGDYDTKDEELDLALISDGLATPVYPYSFDTTLSSDDFADLSSFKDGDYVLVTAYEDGADYTIDSIVKAQSVSGTVTEYVDDDTVTLGGKEYSYNVTATANPSTDYQYEVKEEATLYLDAQGNVLWAEGAENDGNYIYVSEFAGDGFLTANSGAQAYAYFLDGTDEAITLNKLNGDKVKKAVDNNDGTITVAGTTYGAGWYTYTLKDTGKYDLKRVTTTNITAKADGTVTDYDSQKTDLGNGTYFGNKNTKFIIVDSKGDVKVATGIKNVPDTKVAGAGNAVKAVLDGTSYAKYVFINVGASGTVKGGNASSDTMLVLKRDATYGHDSDNDMYYRFKVILNGEQKTVKIDAGESITVGALYNEIEYNSKGYIVDETIIADGTSDSDFYAKNPATGATFQYKNQTVIMSIGGSVVTNFYMADNAKIYYVTDKDDVSTITGSALTKKAALTAGSSVYAVKNGDKEVSALYIYVK